MEHTQDRAQRQADRQTRIARQEARDRDKLAKDMQRAADEAKKKLAPKAGGGGGGSKKPSDEQKKQQAAQQKLQTADATAAKVGLAAGDVATLRQAAESGGARSDALSRLGLLGPDGLATDQGRRALSALERGDTRGYNAALQDASARMGRETRGRPATAAGARGAGPPHSRNARRPSSARLPRSSGARCEVRN